MAQMAFETITTIRRRLETGETTIEGAAADFSLTDLAEGLRMTGGALQTFVDG